jgi:ketosteroid isomerase-like protein
MALLAGLLIGGLLACTRAPAAPEADRAALQAEIQRWMKAVNAQDVATLAATMTEDVELADNAATVTGRDAAIRALRETAGRGRLAATTREIKVSDDFAWHVALLTQTQKNGVLQARGQALEIWKRHQGQWQLHRRVVTGDNAPEVSLTRPSTKEPVLDRPKD